MTYKQFLALLAPAATQSLADRTPQMRLFISYAIAREKGDAATAVKLLRSATGLSQVAFCEAFGIPRRTLQNWETATTLTHQWAIDLLAYAVYMSL